MYDWFRGDGVGQYATGDSTARYDALAARIDELVAEKQLWPALDIRTVSEENYKHGGATFYSDMEAWHAHPNTAGMIAAARILAAYLTRHCGKEGLSAPAPDQPGTGESKVQLPLSSRRIRNPKAGQQHDLFRLFAEHVKDRQHGAVVQLQRVVPDVDRPHWPRQ